MNLDETGLLWFPQGRSGSDGARGMPGQTGPKVFVFLDSNVIWLQCLRFHKNNLKADLFKLVLLILFFLGRPRL